MPSPRDLRVELVRHLPRLHQRRRRRALKGEPSAREGRGHPDVALTLAAPLLVTAGWVDVARGGHVPAGCAVLPLQRRVPKDLKVSLKGYHRKICIICKSFIRIKDIRDPS